MGRLPRALAVLAASGAGLVSPPGAGAGVSRCDPIDPSRCLLPWPNDLYTVRDPTTGTRRRLALPRADMPANADGVRVDPTDLNRSDGFSPGQVIVTRVPGLDTPAAFRRTGAVSLRDIGRSFAPAQPVVVLNARTGRRHPVWAELDALPRRRADVALLIHPARNFEEGERYVVALRDLRDAGGRVLRPGPAFRAYRDRRRTGRGGFERRRPHMEAIFRMLARAGIARRSLYRAWDFTVASERGLTQRMLSIRDRAFAELGDRRLGDRRVQGRAPRFRVERITQRTACPGAVLGVPPAECVVDPELDRRVARRVEGRVFVPCFLDRPGCPSGARFRFAPGSNRPLRSRGAPAGARFVCNVPAVDGGRRRFRPSLYGHGLLGEATEVNQDKLYDLHDDGLMFCATDWSGMSEEDLPNAARILQDLSRFPTLGDRVQQGMLNFLFLGRALIHPDGLGRHPAFRAGGRSVIDNRRLYYDGGSQGGIIGGALTAVAPDFTRAALGVPGMNYSVLLTRSTDWDTFASIMYPSYPDVLARPLLLSMVQVMWDRAEANGYAHHMTHDALPDTPRHEILLHEAFGDHQVTNWATEAMARTAGARLRVPALDRGRHPAGRAALYGLRPIPRYPFAGSALVVWDIGPLRDCDPSGEECRGTTPPPLANLPNRRGVDPHGPDASETVDGQRQIAAFLSPRGHVVSVCGRRPCYLDGWRGASAKP